MVLVDRVGKVGPAVSVLTGLLRLSQGLVQEDEATIYVHDLPPNYQLTRKWKSARQPDLFESQQDQNSQQM